MEEPPRPCAHMTTLLSALADDALTGIARWYAENHTKRCPHCSASLASLHVLRDRVRTIGIPDGAKLQLSEDRWAKIEAAWDESDRATAER